MFQGFRNFKIEGAAKTLKARSFYVQVLTKLTIQYVSNYFNLTSSDYIEIDSGGNFTLLIKEGNFNKDKFE